MILLAGALGAIARGQTPDPRQDPNPGGFGEPGRPVEVARPAASPWPGGIEMVREILRGGTLAPGTGWFAADRSRTRFDWASVAARLDRDRDGSIARAEFPGPDADYRRLDRDHDRKLTSLDFEFPTNALARSRSKMVMSFADRNLDGRISANEYGQMMFMAERDQYTKLRYFADEAEDVVAAYKESDRKGMPFLGLGDLRETVDVAAARKNLEVIPEPDRDVEPATRSTLLKALARREIGSMHAGPGLGELAPDFTLPLVEDGRGPVTLSKLLGRKKPVVLVFGSSTDFGSRNEAGTLEKLGRNYRDRAEFLMVYVRESRPSDGWASKANVQARISIPQPVDARQRLKVAQEFRKRFGLGWPMVVDGMDDRVGILYSGMPDRIYLLDPSGRVAYKGGRGPFGFKPDEVEQSLLLLLQAESSPAPKPGGPVVGRP